jgi:tRNA A-37 threonylcarbamoyl transferase component Bud32
VPHLDPAVGGPELVLLSPATAPAYLRERGVIGAGAARVDELGGGVSNVVLAVATDEKRVVLKQALPQLRVASEWLAKRERALAEARGLEIAGSLAPGSVPRVLDVDTERCALTIEAAPPAWTTWKDRLLAGDIDPGVAARLGALLAGWHSGTSVLADELDEWDSFDQLRIDPYYREIARRHPAYSDVILAYVDAMAARRVCLVHGDFSPKNVLVGDPGLWLIDFEVTHRGDPAFDVAFLLTHLSLKALHHGDDRAALLACAQAFDVSYRAACAAPEERYVLGHVACLLLARVDGKSPAEYLDDATRARTRALALSLLLAPPGSLGELAAALRDND